jgi:hypothetical protein
MRGKFKRWLDHEGPTFMNRLIHWVNGLSVLRATVSLFLDVPLLPCDVYTTTRLCREFPPVQRPSPDRAPHPWTFQPPEPTAEWTFILYKSLSLWYILTATENELKHLPRHRKPGVQLWNKDDSCPSDSKEIIGLQNRDRSPSVGKLALKL